MELGRQLLHPLGIFSVGFFDGSGPRPPRYDSVNPDIVFRDIQGLGAGKLLYGSLGAGIDPPFCLRGVGAFAAEVHHGTGTRTHEVGMSLLQKDDTPEHVHIKGERPVCAGAFKRSEEHTSELQSLMRISYAVFCLKKKKKYI